MPLTNWVETQGSRTVPRTVYPLQDEYESLIIHLIFICRDFSFTKYQVYKDYI